MKHNNVTIFIHVGKRWSMQSGFHQKSLPFKLYHSEELCVVLRF